MSDPTPVARRVVEIPDVSGRDVSLADVSLSPLWRVFTGPPDVRPGIARRLGDALVWSVSPGEWTVLGSRPGGETVDLSHVRAVFRLSGGAAARLLNKVCALDLGDDMFPPGAAARTLVAGVATELVRDDDGGARSYLVLPSRSFGAYLHATILDAGRQFGL